jgi:hypothetical protein
MNLNLTDIDECSSKPCNENAICGNFPGNFSCTCKTSYTGNGTHCTGRLNYLHFPHVFGP